MNDNFPNSMVLNLVSDNEVINIVNSFKSGSAAGYDNISMNIIKQSIHLIVEPITHIINLSITNGAVPDKMKLARVIPVFKCNDQTQLSNYRPISVLPAFSKILERVIYNRMVHYLDNYNILCHQQFGFRKGYSTSMALIRLFDQLSTAIDNKKFTIGIFLDLSKAFDTVNHEILFTKLEHYGFRGIVLDWMKSYFINRMQFVQYNNHCSDLKEISCGVPQGSILGPLLFLLYINDICNVSQILEVILFADDTNVFYSHQDLHYLVNTMNKEMNKLSEWLKINKLTLNLEKTKYILFKPRQKRQYMPVDLFIDGTNINQVHETSFLGVVLDENITWKSHISYISSKISKSIGIILRSSFYLFKSSLKTLYYGLVYPYLQYCNIVWASTYQSNLNRIVILQKRIVRIISKVKFDSHTNPLYKELNILKFHDICKLQMGQFLFSWKNNSLPNYFNDMFTLNAQLPGLKRRNVENFRIPYCRTKLRKFSLRFQGPKRFNSLPVEVISVSTPSHFKVKMKSFLTSSYDF